MSLPLTPYKGARDFYPEDKLKQNYIFSNLRQTVKLFGYEEYDAPILEAIEIYKAKSGEEIVNEQTYKFIDRGGREVAIRPEMTPTVSRMVAARRQELIYPLRWFSIPNLWRYERPQRGRLREHWQLNVDLFGVVGYLAELELIMISDAIFKNFGANREMYTIKINHRGFTDHLLNEYLKLDVSQTYSMVKLIDRKAKMENNEFLAKVDEILSAKQKEEGISEKLLGVLNCSSLAALPEALKSIKPIIDIKRVIASCQQYAINNVVFDPTIMRGFDYYNGVVFEVNDNHPDNNRSMMGGGRYDGLVGLFGVEPLPTAGFGLGDTTLGNFLELHNLMPKFSSETMIYIVTTGEDVIDDAIKVAAYLRSKKINVAIDFSHKKLGDQIKSASKKNIGYVLIIGKKEIESQYFTLRDLNSSSEETISLEQIASKIH